MALTYRYFILGWEIGQFVNTFYYFPNFLMLLLVNVGLCWSMKCNCGTIFEIFVPEVHRCWKQYKVKILFTDDLCFIQDSSLWHRLSSVPLSLWLAKTLWFLDTWSNPLCIVRRITATLPAGYQMIVCVDAWFLFPLLNRHLSTHCGTFSCPESDVCYFAAFLFLASSWCHCFPAYTGYLRYSISSCYGWFYRSFL